MIGEGHVAHEGMREKCRYQQAEKQRLRRNQQNRPGCCITLRQGADELRKAISRRDRVGKRNEKARPKPNSPIAQQLRLGKQGDRRQSS